MTFGHFRSSRFFAEAKRAKFHKKVRAFRKRTHLARRREKFFSANAAFRLSRATDHCLRKIYFMTSPRSSARHIGSPTRPVYVIRSAERTSRPGKWWAGVAFPCLCPFGTTPPRHPPLLRRKEPSCCAWKRRWKKIKLMFKWRFASLVGFVFSFFHKKKKNELFLKFKKRGS